MHSRVVLQFLAEKYSKYLRAEVNRRENSESSGSPSSLVADAGDNLTGQGCLGSCGKASAILRRIKQPPASPRNMMPVFRVTSIRRRQVAPTVGNLQPEVRLWWRIRQRDSWAKATVPSTAA